MSQVRQSQYEEGVYFVRGETWQVGKRYTIDKVLGSGSFSSVCLAIDKLTHEKVALKRIPNVISEPEQAKRVLREVCILRRMSHPNLISLKDAFVTPADTGPYKLLKGQLVPLSIDLYLALEYADGGDLFDLRGQLSADEVRWLMWQILQAVKYLHERNVWHRDLKSANILTSWSNGQRIIKIADFGSARAGLTEFNLHTQHSLTRAGLPPLPGGKRPRPVALPQADSFAAVGPREELIIQRGPSKARIEQHNSQYSRPLTRCVATPCYRAPEVVMSRGGYTSAIDIWSVGCIFGELIQRISKIGSAATPNLSVAPLFAVHGMPKTPSEGETFGSPSCVNTRKELEALFSVIGTPSWADAEKVQSPQWRHYLQKLPGRSPTLFRRFGSAGEPAVDLLRRMLAFEPAQRCTAEEALAHECLADVVDMMDVANHATEIEAASREASREAVLNAEGHRAGAPTLPHSTVSFHSTVSQASTNSDTSTDMMQMGMIVDAVIEVQRDCGSYPEAFEVAISDHGELHYYDESDPARALQMLEDDMLSVSAGATEKKDVCDKLKELLEREVKEVQDAYQQRSVDIDLAQLRPTGAHPRPKWLVNKKGVLEEILDKKTSLRLELDSNALCSPLADGSSLAEDRLGNVADTWQGLLEPEKYLGPHRHGEWTTTSGAGTQPGPAWGVTAIPPGWDANSLDQGMLAAIRKQQGR